VQAGREQNTGRVGVSLAQMTFERLGFIFREQSVHDYGIDAHVELIEDGHPTGRLFALQIKSGPSYFQEELTDGFVARPSDNHIKYWLEHSLPVILLLCDTERLAVYWELISSDTTTTTGSGWKLVVPKAQTVTQEYLESFRQIATKVIPSHRYTVLSQGDISWAGAKRYSLDILLNGTSTKAEIASVIRQVVLHYMGSRYYRDEFVEKHWKDSDAHVIFLFVYLTLDDRRTANWVCRSLWIDERLPHDQAPSDLTGENIGHSIITEWSSHYESMATFWQKHTLRKEDYLRVAIAILNELKVIVHDIALAIGRENAENEASSHIADETLRDSEPRISKLYHDATRIGLAPVECRDVDRKLQTMAASAHNLVLPFCDFATDKRRNRFIERMALEDFGRELRHLEYELEKVR
jgi:uncharacterized protein DUF4365